VEAARGPHTGAGGAKAPRRGRREPRGVPEETLLSKGIQMTPEGPPDARQNTRMAPDPELHLSEDVPSLTPLSSSPSSSRVSDHVAGGYLLGRGTPPEGSPRPDEFVVGKLDTEQNQQPTTERKDRSHLPNPPTVSAVNKDGVQVQRNKRIPGSGTGHGNIAAARGTPAQEPQAPEAQRAPKSKTKRLMCA
jgi:hypothetical protein